MDRGAEPSVAGETAIIEDQELSRWLEFWPDDSAILPLEGLMQPNSQAPHLIAGAGVRSNAGGRLVMGPNSAALPVPDLAGFTDFGGDHGGLGSYQAALQVGLPGNELGSIQAADAPMALGMQNPLMPSMSLGQPAPFGDARQYSMPVHVGMPQPATSMGGPGSAPRPQDSGRAPDHLFLLVP